MSGRTRKGGSGSTILPSAFPDAPAALLSRHSQNTRSLKSAMVELRILGGVSLKGQRGEDLSSVLSHSKRLALLSYLSLVALDGFVSRDRLVALFWPEADEGRARNALSQVLHALRGELGEGVILNRGRREIGLSPDLFSCDAVAFQEAARVGANEAALALYTGHLLEGFHVGNAPEFHNWLWEERGRLREMAAGAAWALAHGYLEAGRLVDSERMAQRALGLVCTDESEVRRFIQALAAAGDRAGAVQFFERFRQRLEQELELEPDSRTEGLVQRLRDGSDATVGGTFDAAWLGSSTPGPFGENGPEAPDPEATPGGVVGTRIQEATGTKGQEEAPDLPPGAGAPGRRVFGGRLLPWALACLAGGWASSKAATMMVARFQWPEPVGQVASLFIVMAAFGFFFALILAFYFGEKARGQATGPEMLVVAVVMLAAGTVLSRVGAEGPLEDLVGSGLRSIPAVTQDRVSMIILPWKAHPDGGGDPSVYEGVRSELMGRLSREDWLRIVLWETVGSGKPPPSTADEIAREGGTDYVLEVEGTRRGDRLTFTTRLLAPGIEEPIWVGELERSWTEGPLAGLGTEMAEALSAGVRQDLTRGGL